MVPIATPGAQVCPGLQLTYLYSLDCKLDPGQEIGTGPHGYRRHVPIVGGTFWGKFGLQGNVLPGGGDHMIVENHKSHVDTRYMLQTDDGAYIYIRTRGGRFGDAETLKKIKESGEGSLSEQEQKSHSFHLRIVLETGDEKYKWLNDRIIVGRARKTPEGIAYDAFLLENDLS